MNSIAKNLNYFLKYMETKTYRIELIEGEFFGIGDDNSQHFFDSLFNSFSLLSWLS